VTVLAIVLAFVLAIGVLLKEPEHTTVAIYAFMAASGGGVLSIGGEGVARNWAGRHEPSPDD
jgi:hypothetical protein